MADAPPLHVLLDLLEAGADLARLGILDAGWSEGERRTDLSDRDREALVRIANEIDTTLATIERHGANLRSIYDEHRDLINGRAPEDLETRLPKDTPEKVRRSLVAEDGDYASRFVDGADTLVRLAGNERVEIRRKVPPLRLGRPVETDISDATMCGVGASLAAEGAFLGWSSGGFATIGAEMIAIGVLYMDQSC